MADTKISALTAMTVMEAVDEFVIVDKSDTTQAASGSTKRLPLSVMLADPVFLAAFDARYVAVPTVWTAVTFANSWVDFGAPAQAVQYRKVGDIVMIRGAMKTGTINLAAFTLPVGFRPPANLSFATISNSALGFFGVDTAGVCTPISGSNVIFNLNIEFSVT